VARRKITGGATAGGGQVACTLTSAGLAAQAGRWERLADRAIAERTETADGLRIRFRAHPGVESELRELVAVENDCCRWAAWTVQTADDHVALDIRSQGEGVTVLHGMFRSGAERPGSADQNRP
jgi:hypothetical protein